MLSGVISARNGFQIFKVPNHSQIKFYTVDELVWKIKSEIYKAASDHLKKALVGNAKRRNSPRNMNQ